MDRKELKTKEHLRMLTSKIADLPLGFILGAVAGGGLFLYSARRRGPKAVRVATGIAKLVAPYVIVAVLDRIAKKNDSKSATA